MKIRKLGITAPQKKEAIKYFRRYLDGIASLKLPVLKTHRAARAKRELVSALKEWEKPNYTAKTAMQRMTIVRRLLRNHDKLESILMEEFFKDAPEV